MIMTRQYLFLPGNKWILMTLALLFFSCSPTRKFDYRQAYKFKYLRHHQKPDSTPPENLMASRTGVVLLPEPVFAEQYIREGLSVPPAPQRQKVDMQGIYPEENDLAIGPGSAYAGTSTGLGEEPEFKPPETGHRLGKYEKRALKKEIKKRRKQRKPGLFRDAHPALKGFIWVAIGLGVVLLSILLIPAELISLILVIIGFGLVAFGFIKMLLVLI